MKIIFHFEMQPVYGDKCFANQQ